MRRHQLDPFSLVFGATLAFLGLLFLLAEVDISSLHLQWIWPVPLIVLGALIIALAIRGTVRDERRATGDQES